MTTGRRYKGFFAKAILGALEFEDWIFNALREHVEDVVGRSVGETVLDPTTTGLGITTTEGVDAINDRRMTITGDLPCMSNSGHLMRCGDGISLLQDIEGSRTITLQDPAWFEDLPYENADGSTYYVYLGRSNYPIDVGIARDGSRGYSDIVDVPGFTVNPNVVTDTGTYLELGLNAVLTSLGMQQWLTSNNDDPDWSYDCVVWLDTDQTGVEIATDDPDVAIAFFAKLVRNGVTGAWTINLNGFGDGYLGQATPSTTPAHYKVCILGPLITNTNALQSDDDWVFVGTVASAVASETEDTSGQVITSPYATYSAGFGVEHNNTPGDPNLGRHKQVTAEAGSQLLIRVDDPALTDVILQNIGGGGARVRADGANDLIQGRDVRSYNGFFPVVGSEWDDHLTWDALYMMAFAPNENAAAGGGSLNYVASGGADPAHIHPGTGLGNSITFRFPIFPPDLFEVEYAAMRIWAAANYTPGTPNTLLAQVWQWDDGNVLPLVLDIFDFSLMIPPAGAWVPLQIPASAPFQIDRSHTGNEDRHFWIEITIVNGPTTPVTGPYPTLKIHDFALVGKVHKIPQVNEP